MKRQNTKIQLFAIVFILMLFAACTPKMETDMVKVSSENGILLTDLVIENYNEIDSLTFVDKYYKDLIEVLSSPVPGDIALPDNEKRDFSDEIHKKISAFRALRELYENLNLITNRERPLAKPNVRALIRNYKRIAYHKVFEKPEDTLLFNDRLRKLERANRIYEHYEMISELSDKYLKLWTDDMPKWQRFIEQMSLEYIKHLEEAPIGIYDAEKIKEKLKEPYSDDAALIQVYRLKLRQDMIMWKKNMLQRLQFMTQSLQLLRDINAELAKKEPNKTEVERMVEELNHNMQIINKSLRTQKK